MTKQEQNTIVKEAIVRNLKKHNNIPEDIGDIFRTWVQGLVQQAVQQVMQQKGAGGEQSQQGNGQPQQGGGQ